MISLEPISGAVHNHTAGSGWLGFLEQNKVLLYLSCEEKEERKNMEKHTKNDGEKTKEEIMWQKNRAVM